jgi:hypothetical protein
MTSQTANLPSALPRGSAVAVQTASRYQPNSGYTRTQVLPCPGPGHRPMHSRITHHTLRDARSAGSGIFCQFGLMTDDYTPKPAFHLYQDLVSTLS